LRAELRADELRAEELRAAYDDSFTHSTGAPVGASPSTSSPSV